MLNLDQPDAIGKWHYVAFIRDTSSNKLKAYLNGQEFESEKADPQVGTTYNA